MDQRHGNDENSSAFFGNPDRCSGRVDQILSATDESEPGVELVLDAIQLVGTNTELTS
jgi:hypothetical protein